MLCDSGGTGYDRRPAYVRFLVDEVAIGHDFSEYYDFPLAVLLHHCTILT